MVLNFKYGFKYKGLNYGWNNKKLFRLPSTKNLKTYPLKELKEIKINNKLGYRVCRDKKTITQLMELTELINYIYTINGYKSDDCPF